MKTFQEGLEAAARFLEATALDYEQMSERKREDRSSSGLRLRPTGLAEAKVLSEKAQLLRGQATHIRGLSE